MKNKDKMIMPSTNNFPKTLSQGYCFCGEPIIRKKGEEGHNIYECLECNAQYIGEGSKRHLIDDVFEDINDVSEGQDIDILNLDNSPVQIPITLLTNHGGWRPTEISEDCHYQATRRF